VRSTPRGWRTLIARWERLDYRADIGSHASVRLLPDDNGAAPTLVLGFVKENIVEYGTQCPVRVLAV
jgi:hypothetical protein